VKIAALMRGWFDRRQWPDPQAMVEELRHEGIEAAVSVWPTLSPLSTNFAAMRDSGHLLTADNGARVGVYVGSGIGGFEAIEREHEKLLEHGPKRVSPFFITATIVNLAAGQISIRYGAKGPTLACATACTTGAHAIGEAYRMIRLGYLDAAITQNPPICSFDSA